MTGSCAFEKTSLGRSALNGSFTSVGAACVKAAPATADSTAVHKTARSHELCRAAMVHCPFFLSFASIALNASGVSA